jgi:hypothetical protein
VRTATRRGEPVLSTLGVSRASAWPWAATTSPPGFMATSLGNTVQVLRELGVTCIVVVSAGGEGDSVGDMPRMFRWLVAHSRVRVQAQDSRSPFGSLNELKFSIHSHQPVLIAKLAGKLSAFHRQAGLVGRTSKPTSAAVPYARRVAARAQRRPSRGADAAVIVIGRRCPGPALRRGPRCDRLRPAP